MRKVKYAVLLLSVLLVCMMLCGTACASSTQQKKIVYVVLDDSGSMMGNRWSYANYAVQVLAGLMNEGDEMRLYVLNSKKVHTIDLSSIGISKSLSSVSKLNCSGGTPFSRVKQAQQDIHFRNIENGARYWLFVISDGEYDEYRIGTGDQLRKEFLKFADEDIGNQHYPLEIVYFTIGDRVNRIDTNTRIAAELSDKGIYCYHAEQEKDIVQEMDKIAERISGRSRVEGNDLNKLDSRTIEITASIPLFNFMVLSQNNNAVLTSVACSTGAALQVSRTAPASAPTPAFGNALRANVFTVDAQTGHIPPGTYTLTFNRNMDLSNVSVLCEPALQVVLSMDDPATVIEGGKFDVSARILEYGTQNVYQLNQLPKGSKLELQVQNGKNKLKKDGDQPQITVNNVDEDEMTVIGTLKIPGFPDIVTQEQFVPIPLPDISGEVVGSHVLTATEEQLKFNSADKTKYIDFQIKLNGSTKVSASQLQAQNWIVETTLKNYDLEFKDRGILRFYPHYTNGMALGDYELSLSVMDAKAGKLKMGDATINVVPSTFALQADKTPLRVKEAAFAVQEQTFRFTLLVDGKTADIARYPNIVVFSDLIPGNPLTVSVEKGKWAVNAHYVKGMQPQTYSIQASINGSQPHQVAELIVEPSTYELSVNKKDFTFKQSELAKVKAKDFSFNVTLKEDGTRIPPDKVQIEGWPTQWIKTDINSKKPNEMNVTLSGDLSVEPKDHFVTLSYTNISGQTVTETVTVHILPAQFTLTLTPDKRMIFNTVQEFANNTDTFRFDIRVDGRTLTDDEMKVVAKLDVSKLGDTSTDWRMEDSGFVVHPRVESAWQTNEKLIDYSVTCIVGEGCSNEVRKEAQFRYHFIVYSVECFQGDGISFPTVDLVVNKQALYFRILADQVPLGYDDVVGNFTVDIPQKFRGDVKMETKVLSNGEIEITPVHSWPAPIHHYRKMFIPEDVMDVTVTFNHLYRDTAQVELTQGHWFYKVIAHVGSLLAILYVFFSWRKKRFCWKSRIYVAKCQYSEGTITGVLSEKKLRTWPHQWFWCFGSHRKRLESVRFRAVERGMLGSRKLERAQSVQFYHAKRMEVAELPSPGMLPLVAPFEMLITGLNFKRKAEDCAKEDEWLDLDQSKAYVVRKGNEYIAIRYVMGIRERNES